MKIAYVVPAAPHYKDVNGEERVWLGRASAAVNEALLVDAPIVFSGDANGGHDLTVFANYAYDRGVKHVVKARNGELKNTRGDARAVARAVLVEDVLHDVDRLIVVTCWYHVPRFRLALRQELNANTSRHIALGVLPVFGRAPPTGLLNELRGYVDYHLQRPHKTRGGHVGKPDFR